MPKTGFSGCLWDTVWVHDPASGTMGDWAITPAPSPDAEPLNMRARADADEDDDKGETDTGGFINRDHIGTAIIIALMTDKRLPDDMLGRYGLSRADQREWHGNTFGIDPASGEEELGSLLYTLRRAPLTYATARVAEHYCALALQPLIRAKWVNSFTIEAQIDKSRGLLGIHVVAHADQDRHFYAELYTLR